MEFKILDVRRDARDFIEDSIRIEILEGMDEHTYWNFLEEIKAADRRGALAMRRGLLPKM